MDDNYYVWAKFSGDLEKHEAILGVLKDGKLFNGIGTPPRLVNSLETLILSDKQLLLIFTTPSNNLSWLNRLSMFVGCDMALNIEHRDKVGC